MGFVLLLVVGLVAWFSISAVNRAKTRMAYADQREAERTMENMEGEPHLKPTWVQDRERLREFAHAAARLSERRGVPVEYFQHLFSDDARINRLMHFITLLERRGSGLTAQKIAAADYVVSQWFLAPSSQQNDFMTAELKRKLGG